MGANASALVNPAKAESKILDDKAREQLEILLKLADARLDTYQHELENMFVDSASEAKRSVPGKRALRFARYVGVNVGQEAQEERGGKTTTPTNAVVGPVGQTSAPDSTEDEQTETRTERHSVTVTKKAVAKSTTIEIVEETVCNFFNIDKKKWDDNKAAYKAGGIPNTAAPEDKRVAAIRGFAQVVSNGLKDILFETTSAGETIEKKFFVCIHHNAVIRIDIMTYRYNFAKSSKDGKSLVDEFENIFGYVYCLSVVDHREVTDDELIFLASEFAGDSLSEFGAYLDQLVAVWAKLRVSSPLTPGLIR